MGRTTRQAKKERPFAKGAPLQDRSHALDQSMAVSGQRANREISRPAGRCYPLQTTRRGELPHGKEASRLASEARNLEAPLGGRAGQGAAAGPSRTQCKPQARLFHPKLPWIRTPVSVAIRYGLATSIASPHNPLNSLSNALVVAVHE